MRHILMKIMKMAVHRVDFLLDTYNSPCLKDIARDIRGDDLDDGDEVYAFGSGQKTPSNFLTLLKYSNFKREFLRFFFEEIRKDEYAHIIGSKVLYCSVDNECVRLHCDQDGTLIVEEIHELYGAHEEADTRVAFHTGHIDQLNPGNTIIRCNDTDILIIMLANIEKFSQTHLWLDMGLDYNNSRTHIDVNQSAENIDFLKALPGVYAYTGCDYVPAFFRKGKKRPVEIMLKSTKYIDTFNKLGQEELTVEDADVLESFTCTMFGYDKLSSINEARYHYFKSKCKPKEVAKPLEFLKHVDPSMFPPCQSVLLEQIKRAWLIARLYKNASAADPLENCSLLDFGYELVDNLVQIKWFDGDQVPAEAEDDVDAALELSDEEGSDEDDEVTDEEDSEESEDENSDDDRD